ncbi:putative integrase/recombinase [Actinoplanes missouriensis 431]|uniref:Putative integrase/recombinase n=1 Tax=Actinoplanes missouriensis (strain ATCC 14538 / DSM 43046 / CBS 188.64 / JCM 3121 / NBRC 102363 / NCIMB 12654 / NRRL B-3342 / UNCC 431) TaxID=512565 RepID=I0H8J6_ACTM4|nr:tyrosine-type recombinase/integrase [Actinoplanes missouriensis]BAL89333.1 putative integrase/recombinase [Actinoplanes missouriensis 431]
MTDELVVAETTWAPALPTPMPTRLAELTTMWLSRQRSVHTRTAYRRDLWQWGDWCAATGRNPLTARPADLDAWIVEQRATGARGKPAAESTIARRLSAVASWYDYLVVNTAADPEPLIAYNPAQAAARPRIDPDDSSTVGLDRPEADRLLAEARADGLTSHALILLLLVAGLRVGSAIGARITDLGADRGHRVLNLTVKGGRRRRVPLPPALSHAIDQMLAERGTPADGPLFLTPTGLPLYELYVHRLIRRLARRAGLASASALSPHSLRHTAITEILDATGGDLRRAQDFAGHADPRTTRRYDRRRDQLDNHGAYLLAGRFGD